MSKVDTRLDSKRLNALNGVKGWLIFVIVIFHTFNGNGLASLLVSPIKHYGGALGNYLFFMMSGFLTAYSFSRKRSDRRFLSYISNKLIKLWPLYALCTLIQVMYIIIVQGIDAVDITLLILSLTLQTGGATTDFYPYVYPGWFLCSLFVCYVINYLTRFICRDEPKKYQWCYLALFIWGIILQLLNLNFPYCYYHDGEAFANFFLGCLCFEYYLTIRKNKHLVYLLAVVGVAGIVMHSLGFSFIKYGFLITICIGPAVITLVLEDGILNKFLSSKISQLNGENSMSIYFLHAVQPVVDIIRFFPLYIFGYFVYLILLIGAAAGFTTLNKLFLVKIRNIKLKKKANQ